MSKDLRDFRLGTVASNDHETPLTKSDKPSAPPGPRACLLLEREDLAQRILELTLYAPGHPPQGPR